MLVFLVLNFLIGVLGQEVPPSPSLDGSDFAMNFVSPVYTCSDEDSLAFIDPSGLETTRVNESTVTMSGVLVYHKGFDHSTMIEVQLLKEVLGKFEMISSFEMCDFCGEIDNPESDYAEYLQYFHGFPDKCPFDAGAYKITDLTADTEHIPLNTANAGTYFVVVNYYTATNEDCKDERIFLGCVKLDVAIEPV